MDWKIFIAVIGFAVGFLCLAVLLALAVRWRYWGKLSKGMAVLASLLKPGTLVSVDEGQRTFRVVKVLAVDEKAVHIRLYRGRWLWRPTLPEITDDDLNLANTGDADGPLAVGHLPVSVEAFARWKPQLLRLEDVASEELEGYKTWKEAGGGVFA